METDSDDEEGDDSQVLGKRNNETLSELKGRMTRLEQMFAHILERVDRIGSDVRHIKDNQDSNASRSHNSIEDSSP
jgi:hypothetical protein